MRKIKDDELYDIFIPKEILLELKELQKLYGNKNYSEILLNAISFVRK